MIPSLALFIAAIILGFASPNRHVRSRLLGSGIAFASYALLAAALRYQVLSPGMRQQIVTIQPLLLVFGAINGLVALLINPWRVDRLPDRFPTIVQDTIVIGLFAIGATMILQERIFAATAVGAVVVGFALQDTLGNLFAGLAIQIEKPFHVGHWVRIAEIDGLVSEITWRAVKVRTKSGNFVIVPNSKLADDVIINYSEPTPETCIEVDIGVSYDAIPNDVKAVIRDAIRDEPLIATSREPEILIVDFAASSITYRVRVWTTDFAADERLRDRIRSAVYYAFRRRNIEIPFPTQVEISRPENVAPPGIGSAREATLRSVSIFSSLSDDLQSALAQATTWSLYEAGDIVVRQGDAGTSMFVVEKGELLVALETGQEVARISPGGFVGEMSLLTGAPRNATVRTAVDSELLEITGEAFRRFVLANPATVDQIAAAVAHRRAELEERRASGTAAPVEPPQTLIDRIRRYLNL